MSTPSDTRSVPRRPVVPSATGPQIAWYRRLEGRVVVGVAFVACLSVTAVLLATLGVVRTNARAQAADALEATRQAFYQLTEDRAGFAAAQLRLIASLPVFRAHMTDAQLLSDPATLDAMANEYRRALDSSFLVVTDPNGVWIADTGWPSGTRPSTALTGAIDGARDGESRQVVLPVANRLYLMVTEPARFATEVLGTLTVGYRLDDAVAGDLARTTNSEVSFLWQGRITATSLARVERDRLAEMLTREDAFAELGTVRSIGRAQYIGGLYPLEATGSINESGALVLLEDWAPTQLFLDQIRTRIVWLGGLVVLCALGGGLVLSRRLSRPLREVAAAAQAVAAGDWDRRVPAYGGDEAAAMATAFNEMTDTLTHWHAEARHRESELRQAQKMEAIGQLAGGVAHDFNNMLTAIHGYADLLLMDLPATDDPRRENVRQILRSIESAGSLTRQLLAFSRKQVLAPRTITLSSVVEGMEKMLRRLIGENIELTVQTHPDLWPVKADPGQIEQVIMNLAVNARDAMPDGGHLSISLENVNLDQFMSTATCRLAPGAYVRLRVRDTGVGMDPETQARVFEPFFTTKEQERGTGLGLAMVDGIVEQSGGAITVESHSSWGTVFSVLLPRALPEGDAAVEGPVPDAASGGSEAILLVEDDTPVREFVREVLEREGYRVLEASRGDEALAMVLQLPGRIDLLLTDVVMPGMNGCALWETLSASRSDASVLFMSGYTNDPVVMRDVVELGLPFLQKPFTYAALVREVRRTLVTPPAAASRQA